MTYRRSAPKEIEAAPLFARADGVIENYAERSDSDEAVQGFRRGRQRSKSGKPFAGCKNGDGFGERIDRSKHDDRRKKEYVRMDCGPFVGVATGHRAGSDLVRVLLHVVVAVDRGSFGFCGGVRMMM